MVMNCAYCESRVCLDGTDCTGQAEQMDSAVRGKRIGGAAAGGGDG